MFLFLPSFLVFCVVLVLTTIYECSITKSFCTMNMLYIDCSIPWGFSLSKQEDLQSVEPSQEYLRNIQKPSFTQRLWSWISLCPFNQQHSLNAKQVYQLFLHPFDISYYKKTKGQNFSEMGQAYSYADIRKLIPVSHEYPFQ